MDLELAGRSVVVTGGASNVGRGIVHGFATEGSRIAICDIDADQAERVSAEAHDLGAEDVIVVAEDLSEEGAGRRTIASVVGAWGRVDVLVNNVGINVPGFFTDQTDRAMWQRTMDVNVFAAMVSLLEAHADDILQDATDQSADRAEEVVRTLHVRLAGFEIGRRVAIDLGELERVDERAARLPLTWEDASGSSLFPHVDAVLRVEALSFDPPYTQVTLSGSYTPPAGVVGTAADRALGHRVAEATFHAFINELVVRIETLLDGEGVAGA